MVVLKAFKYRLKIKRSRDHRALYRYAGCGRFVWNKMLAIQNERLVSGKRCLSYPMMAKLLLDWKREYPFLKEAPSQSLQQRLMDLDRAINDALDPESAKEFPKHKKKHSSVPSFRYPQGFEIHSNSMFLPKLGHVGFFNSRKITGKPKNITVSLVGKYWYASVQTEQDIPRPVHGSSSSVGVDFGVKRLLTLSDGKYHMSINSLKRSMKILANAQRKLSRMVKRSNNWKKQKSKIKDLHIHIANVRINHLHGISCELSKNHAAIALEDLQIQNMTASAKGTKENPGKNVRQKAGLSRAILDQGWGELKRQILYKQAWRGGTVIFVNPAYTSQECSVCGHVSPENRPSQELFYCKKCGHTANADENAANVVKSRAGLARMVCGSNGAVIPSEAETARVTT
jgi:putative transposase